MLLKISKNQRQRPKVKCTNSCTFVRILVRTKKVGLIVNRAPGGKLDEGTLEEIEKQKLDLLGVVPQDEDVYRFDCEGRPTVQLPKDSPVRAALKGIIEKLGI